MISAIIPAGNSRKNIAVAVELARRDPCVSEIILVDDDSTATINHLADSASVKLAPGVLPGKGGSMRDGLRIARNEVVLFLDGNLQDSCPDVIRRMTEPIVERWADLAKPTFLGNSAALASPIVRSVLHSFFPELHSYSQPFSGITAARRGLLESLPFENDYGVDIGLLIDAAMSNAVLAEVDIGHVACDDERLEVLGDAASQILRTIVDRAVKYDRRCDRSIRELQQIHCQLDRELAIGLSRPERPTGLALLAMDGVLVQEPFLNQLAKQADKTREFAALLDRTEVGFEGRLGRFAAALAGSPKSLFENMAYEVPLMEGARKAALGLRKSGFYVGVITDGFQVAADVVRRRVGADFSVGHLLRFSDGVATGEVTLSSAMTYPIGCTSHSFCKMNAILQLSERMAIDRTRVLAVGHGLGDLCMLRAATVSAAFRPQCIDVEEAATLVIRESLAEVLDAVQPRQSQAMLLPRRSTERRP
jgi:glucosyl-3-phosphoglycerate synthase